ncbi:MAG: CRISPR-associated helicase Cas3' [Chloroflexi bacterium]|nr:CRISPR-associated helicase Cas3' [Chloroflexota bacterium]
MTNSVDEPVYVRRFWAKSDRQGHGRIHLLEHHMADVGACFEALLVQPTIRQRLARSGGSDTLDDATVARLALFAALHDIGKVNVGFQTQIWRDADRPVGRRRPGRAGHTLDLTPVLMNEDRETTSWFFNALDWWQGATESWDDRGGESFCGLFIAALSHHGQPLQLEGRRSRNPAIWRPYGNLHPAEGVKHIGELARRWFPAAWEPTAPPLPPYPAFQHMFLGLCILADWIGSNENWFPFCDEPRDDYMADARKKARDALKLIGLDLHEQRRQFAGVPGFDGLFPRIGQLPNAIQQAAAQRTPLDEPLIIIESETGSGKTEAALWRFARMYKAGLVDGLYFALPTRAAAVQIHDRVKRFTANLFTERLRPPVVLAVPGYEPDTDAGGVRLPDYKVWWDSQYNNERPWSSERPKRYLAAQIAVGTVDQAMMGALKIKHAHMRAACLARSLLVVDEVHASDTYMRRILKALLDAHLGAGGYAVLMSATLGSAARQEWLPAGRTRANGVIPLDEAVSSPYPAVSVTSPDGERITSVEENGQQKTVHLTAEPLMHDFDAVVDRALRAARNGAKVLVIRNTVTYAIDTQTAVEHAAADADGELLFAVGADRTLHHGRFAAGDRRLLDRAVEEQLGKDRASGGVVVVGTQTLEQSLDIDADLLITDLCPMDVLLQRIGRLHRHSRDDRPAGYEAPHCVVLTPDEGDLTPLLQRGPDRNGLGPHGYVYEDLRVLEATWRLIGELPQWDIPAMNRQLVEHATHPEALEAIVRELEPENDLWRVHANQMMGGQLAEGLTAQDAIIQRDKSFFSNNREVLFGTAEERIRTRLGDESIEVEFAPPPPGAFGASRLIDRIAIPVRWLGGADVDGSVRPVTLGGGFTFAIGDRSFRYDRRGLRWA